MPKLVPLGVQLGPRAHFRVNLSGKTLDLTAPLAQQAGLAVTRGGDPFLSLAPGSVNHGSLVTFKLPPGDWLVQTRGGGDRTINAATGFSLDQNQVTASGSITLKILGERRWFHSTFIEVSQGPGKAGVVVNLTANPPR